MGNLHLDNHHQYLFGILQSPTSHALQDLDPDYLAASFLFVKGVIFVNINYVTNDTAAFAKNI